MTRFLTVNEAAKLTGKSPSSIRRVIYPIIRDDVHPDRQHIAPSVDDVRALRMKGENFAWRIFEEFLLREIPVTPPSEKTAIAAQPSDQGHAELLAMLREELRIKNEQIKQHSELIAKQMELINGLSERVREGNLLIGTSQQRLALASGSERRRAGVTIGHSQTRRASEPSTKRKNKPNFAAKSSKKNRSWLHRVFG